MIIEVQEINYKGFHIVHVENKGWKILLDDVSYLFPTLQDAQATVDEFYKSVIPKHNGKKYK